MPCESRNAPRPSQYSNASSQPGKMAPLKPPSSHFPPKGCCCCKHCDVTLNISGHVLSLQKSIFWPPNLIAKGVLNGRCNDAGDNDIRPRSRDPRRGERLEVSRDTLNSQWYARIWLNRLDLRVVMFRAFGERKGLHCSLHLQSIHRRRSALQDIHSCKGAYKAENFET
jgi:hypothetical protein